MSYSWIDKPYYKHLQKMLVLLIVIPLLLGGLLVAYLLSFDFSPGARSATITLAIICFLMFLGPIANTLQKIKIEKQKPRLAYQNGLVLAHPDGRNEKLKEIDTVFLDITDNLVTISGSSSISRQIGNLYKNMISKNDSQPVILTLYRKTKHLGLGFVLARGYRALKLVEALSKIAQTVRVMDRQGLMDLLEPDFSKTILKSEDGLDQISVYKKR